VDDKRKPKKKGGAMLAVAVLLLLPVLYALLAGRVSKNATDGTYAPVIWLVESSETAEAAFDWYCEMFRRRILRRRQQADQRPKWSSDHSQAGPRST
jgi:hypothetical protein